MEFPLVVEVKRRKLRCAHRGAHRRNYRAVPSQKGRISASRKRFKSLSMWKVQEAECFVVRLVSRTVETLNDPVVQKALARRTGIRTGSE
jgi:hypothetical protein